MVKLFSTAFLCAFAFYFPDWLFQRTGNMPLAAFEPSQANLSLSMGLLIFTLGFAGFFLAVQVSAAVIRRLFKKQMNSLVHWVKIIPVAISFALALLLLVNNFTTTLWALNLSQLADTPWKNLYLLGLLAAAVYLAFEMHNLTKFKIYATKRTHILVACAGLLCVLPALVLTIKEKLDPADSALTYTSKFTPDALPNILFLQGDGIDAEKLSVYGFEQQTTPFLDSIKEQMNVWTNFYPSNCCTYGAHYALLTGIHPLTNNVYYPPAQVPVEQSLLSLPNVLRKLGYVTYQDTVVYYADASFMGLSSAFKYGNETLEGQHPLKKFLLKFLPNQSFNWVRSSRRTVLRHTNMLKALTTDAEFKDGLALVETPQTTTEHPDDAKVQRVTHFIESQQKPWFLQVHLMGTHGATFVPRKPFFSHNRLPQQPWQAEFYLDAIRDWDADVAKIIGAVSAARNSRPTWIFITSDHGMAWNSANKIPLLTLKVESGQTKRMFQNTNADSLNSLLESIDLPKTVSMELGLEPSTQWMQGQHVLDMAQRRFVLAANGVSASIDEGHFSMNLNKDEKFSGASRLSLVAPSGQKKFQTLDPTLNLFQLSQSVLEETKTSAPLQRPVEIAVDKFKTFDFSDAKESLSAREGGKSGRGK